jgi:hypothetical protein
LLPFFVSSKLLYVVCTLHILHAPASFVATTMFFSLHYG